MIVPPKKEEHYGAEVFVNPTTESLRRSECLCLNCDNLKEGDGNCIIAKELYQISVNWNVAMAITRCPAWKPKRTSPQA